MKRALISLALILVACSVSEPKPLQTDVRSLTTAPERFSGKHIEVEGVLALGFEAMIFEDPVAEEPTEIWFDYADGFTKEKEKRGFDRLLAAFDKAPAKEGWKLDRRVHVRVVGVFSHEKVSAFGHLGHFRSRLLIERVIEAEPCKTEPNKALVPTVMSVTPAADAPVAPATTAAHL